MLQNGAFWLLDEPTASLDANSERLVLESLALAVTNRTTLMVSHRLDQLHAMDRILVMDNGKLVQNGAFDAIRHQGLFADMLTSTDKRDLDA